MNTKSVIPSRRITVTGSNGQLASEIGRIANEYSNYTFTFLSHKEFPLEDPDKIAHWLNQFPTDIFIHCAAYTAVDKAESEKEKVFRINAEAPGQIASALSRTNSQLIFISTDYVFDGTSVSPLREDAITNPVNVYGAAKLKGEHLVQQYNPNTQIIRTSWLFSEFGNNFVKTMLRLMKERHSLNVVQDQIGSPTYAGDLARAIMKMVGSAHSSPGIYHYSNVGEISWYEFALEIKKLTASDCEILPIPTTGYPTPANRPAYSLLDSSKIRREYNLIIPDWQSSLARCIDLIKKLEV